MVTPALVDADDLGELRRVRRRPDLTHSPSRTSCDRPLTRAMARADLRHDAADLHVRQIRGGAR